MDINELYAKYNNESLLYQMKGDNLAAIGALSKALEIVEALPDRRIEVATTYTNIAQLLAALGQMEEAEVNVKEALSIFAETNNTDYHYSSAAAVMGVIAYNRGDYEEAASYYDKAANIIRQYMGENDSYKVLISNRDALLSLIPSVAKDEKEKEEVAISRDDMVNYIVQLEWEAFDKVQNEGGRAGCQDDWTTFEIMRKSQYEAWPDTLLESYIVDFETANSRGWNLIAEKYARMEKTTAPEAYEKIKELLPMHTEAQDALIEQIVAIQVAMMEDMADKYPKMAGNARTIHTSEDTPWNTSYETYLRGELGTYSEETLAVYGRFVANVAREGGNLAYMIMSNTARLYGYDSVDSCEERM